MRDYIIEKIVRKAWGFIKRIIRYVIELILIRIMKKDATEELYANFFQFVKFCFIGISNTIIGYIINILIIIMMTSYEISWDYVLANVVSFVISVLWSFYWNNKLVFNNGCGTNVFLKLFKTYIAYGFTGIILNNILSFVWIDILGVSKFFAPLINLTVSVPMNYVINKFWTFK